MEAKKHNANIIGGITVYIINGITHVDGGIVMSYPEDLLENIERALRAF